MPPACRRSTANPPKDIGSHDTARNKFRQPASSAAQSLSGDAAPMRGYGRHRQRRGRSGSAFLRGLSGMEGAGLGRAYRRISAAAPFRHRAVHNVLSDDSPRNGQRRTLARGARHARHPRRADDGHRRLPEAAGRSRIRGPRARRQGVAGGRRGVRPTARRTGHYGSGRNNQYVVGADVARNQDVVPRAGARLLRAAVQRRRTHGGHAADVLSGRAPFSARCRSRSPFTTVFRERSRTGSQNTSASICGCP